MEGNWKLKSCDFPIKIWITDVVRVPRHKTFTFAYIFKGRFTKSVDIMGTVTSRAEYSSYFIYIVDDGTGAVVCKVNKNLNLDKDEYEELLLSRQKVADSPMPSHLKKKDMEVEGADGEISDSL